jgi:hypothetical protein
MNRLILVTMLFGSMAVSASASAQDCDVISPVKACDHTPAVLPCLACLTGDCCPDDESIPGGPLWTTIALTAPCGTPGTTTYTRVTNPTGCSAFPPIMTCPPPCNPCDPCRWGTTAVAYPCLVDTAGKTGCTGGC